MCYIGGLFNGGEMMLERWPVSWRENGHVTEFNLGRMVVTIQISLMEGEWSC